MRTGSSYWATNKTFWERSNSSKVATSHCHMKFVIIDHITGLKSQVLLLSGSSKAFDLSPSLILEMVIPASIFRFFQKIHAICWSGYSSIGLLMLSSRAWAVSRIVSDKNKTWLSSPVNWSIITNFMWQWLVATLSYLIALTKVLFVVQ